MNDSKDFIPCHEGQRRRILTVLSTIKIAMLVAGSVHKVGTMTMHSLYTRTVQAKLVDWEAEVIWFFSCHSVV
jgi:hypothetical protein